MGLAGVYLAYRFVGDTASPFTSAEEATKWLKAEGYDERTSAWVDRAIFDKPADFLEVWPGRESVVQEDVE